MGSSEKEKEEEKTTNIKMKMLEDLCEQTTMHGPSHMLRNKGTFMGVFWGLATVSCCVGLLCILSGLFTEFAEREIQSRVSSHVAHGEGLQYPSLVICNRAFFSQRKLAKFGFDANMTSYLIMMTGPPGYGKNSILSTPEDRLSLHRASRYLQEILNDNNVTFQELIAAVSYSCEEMVTKCELGSFVYNSSTCCSFFDVLATTSGQCYIHVSGSDNMQVYAGEFLGTTIYLKYEKEDSPVVSPALLDRSRMVKSGVQVTLLSNLTYASFSVTTQGTIITPGTLTSIQLSLIKIDTREMKRSIADFSKPDCLKPTEIDFRNDLEKALTSTTNCVTGSFRQCIGEYCNCSLYGLDNRGKRPCNLVEVMQCYSVITPKANEIAVLDPSTNLTVITEKMIGFFSCLKKEGYECIPVCEELVYEQSITVTPINQDILEDIAQDFGQNLPLGRKLRPLPWVQHHNNAGGIVLLLRDRLQHLQEPVGGHLGPRPQSQHHACHALLS